MPQKRAKLAVKYRRAVPRLAKLMSVQTEKAQEIIASELVTKRCLPEQTLFHYRKADKTERRLYYRKCSRAFGHALEPLAPAQRALLLGRCRDNMPWAAAAKKAGYSESGAAKVFRRLRLTGETAAAKASLSEKAVSEKAIPEKALPETPLLSESVPKEPVPGEPISVDSFLKEPLPGESVPMEQLSGEPLLNELLQSESVLNEDPFPEEPFPKEPLPWETLPEDPFPKEPLPWELVPLVTFPWETAAAALPWQSVTTAPKSPGALPELPANMP